MIDGAHIWESYSHFKMFLRSWMMENLHQKQMQMMLREQLIVNTGRKMGSDCFWSIMWIQTSLRGSGKKQLRVCGIQFETIWWWRKVKESEVVGIEKTIWEYAYEWRRDCRFLHKIGATRKSNEALWWNYHKTIENWEGIESSNCKVWLHYGGHWRVKESILDETWRVIIFIRSSWHEAEIEKFRKGHKTNFKLKSSRRWWCIKS